jgi:hypothetical protein
LFKKTISSIATATLALSGAFALALPANPAAAVAVDSTFWDFGFGDPPSAKLGVVEFRDGNGDNVSLDDLEANLSVTLGFQLSAGEGYGDFKYRWQISQNVGCNHLAVDNGTLFDMPANGTISVPANLDVFYPRHAYLEVLKPNGSGQDVVVAKSGSFIVEGDAFNPGFACSPDIYVVSGVAGIVGGFEFDFSYPTGGAASLSTFTPSFQVVPFAAGSGAPASNPLFDPNGYTATTVCESGTCSVTSSILTASNQFDFAYRAEVEIVDGQMPFYSPWKVVTAAVTPLAAAAPDNGGGSGQAPPPGVPSFSDGIELEIVDEKVRVKRFGNWISGFGTNQLWVCNQPTTGSGTTQSRISNPPPTVFFSAPGKTCLGVGQNSPGDPIFGITAGLDFDVRSWRVNDFGAQRSYAELLERAGGESFVHFVLITETFASGSEYAFWSDSVSFLGQQSSSTGDVARMVPFTGPTLNTPAIPSGVRAGSALTIPGSNLSGVTKVEIGGLDAQVKVNSAGELEIVVPAGLASGTYDIVLTSSEGRVTVQSAITVSAGAGLGAAGESRPSTKRMDDSSAKVYFYGAVGAGKIQFLLNGREIAWVNATDASDRKLVDGYLVRTVTLEAGKNVIEVLVDGVQVRRTVYSN